MRATTRKQMTFHAPELISINQLRQNATMNSKRQMAKRRYNASSDQPNIFRQSWDVFSPLCSLCYCISGSVNCYFSWECENRHAAKGCDLEIMMSCRCGHTPASYPWRSPQKTTLYLSSLDLTLTPTLSRYFYMKITQSWTWIGIHAWIGPDLIGLGQQKWTRVIFPCMAGNFHIEAERFSTVNNRVTKPAEFYYAPPDMESVLAASPILTKI